MDCCLVVLLFVPGGSKSKLIAEGSFAFPYVQGVSQGGLWQERTSESLSGKARGRQLPHFFSFIASFVGNPLWQIQEMDSLITC